MPRAVTSAAKKTTLPPASPFDWQQNDPARSLALRFVAVPRQMPGPAHAAACVAVRHYLPCAVVTQGSDTPPANRKILNTPMYFPSRPSRSRPNARPAAALSLPPVKPPQATRGKWDHYDRIGATAAASADRPPHPTGCRSVPPPPGRRAGDGASWTSRTDWALISGYGKAKKVGCHVD
jgi:hypothetical protein